MRIIKEGQLPEEQLFQGTCNNCNTVFECKRSEGKYSDYQRDGVFLTVACPFCNKTAHAYPAKTSRKVIERVPLKSTFLDYGMESGTW